VTAVRHPPTLQGPTPRRRFSWTLRFGGGPDWSSSQLAVTGAHVAGALVFLTALYRAAGGFDAIFWALAAVPVLTMSYAGAAAPLAFWGLMLYGWFYLSPAGSFSWWSLVAAAGVAIGHAAAAVSASAPPQTHIAAVEFRRWARWTGIAAAAALPVGALAGLLVGRSTSLVPVATVVGLLGIAAGLFLLRTAPPSPRD
jgi:hypothetical protein